MGKKNLKPLPEFKSEDEEREFWANHEIVDYVDTNKPIEMDLSRLKRRKGRKSKETYLDRKCKALKKMEGAGESGIKDASTTI